MTNKNKECIITAGSDECINESCQECCPHEFDHDQCMDCGYERDPGDAIDAAEYAYDPER